MGRQGGGEQGAWRGLTEMVDLKEVWEGEGVVVERERCVRDEAWVGTLSLFG